MEILQLDNVQLRYAPSTEINRDTTIHKEFITKKIKYKTYMLFTYDIGGLRVAKHIEIDHLTESATCLARTTDVAQQFA